MNDLYQSLLEEVMNLPNTQKQHDPQLGRVVHLRKMLSWSASRRVSESLS